MDIPEDLAELLRLIATDFPAILAANLVGIYQWGSLTYDAFHETCSDVDLIVVTQRDLDDREFLEVEDWFNDKRKLNRWVRRVDMRFVIDHEFLDKQSRCCGFYPYLGKLVRHGSDGNPIIWINVAQSGITLWGKDAKLIAPQVSSQCLTDALLLELIYLKQDLVSNAGVRSENAFIHNSYAVLTACRIFYSAQHKALVSKDQACRWVMDTVPPIWRATIQTGMENRLKRTGSRTPELEQNALQLVEFITGQAAQILEQSIPP